MKGALKKFQILSDSRLAQIGVNRDCQTPDYAIYEYRVVFKVVMHVIIPFLVYSWSVFSSGNKSVRQKMQMGLV